MDGSNKSLNSNENKKPSSNKKKILINYYFIKYLNENKEFLRYNNKEESDDQIINVMRITNAISHLTINRK